MFTSLKINTAIFISMAFIFRLLFVNICLFTSQASQLNNVASHFSTVQKKRRNNDAVVKSNFEKYSVVEVCEENLDNEETVIKASTPVLLAFLYTFFKGFIHTGASNNLFNTIKCHLYPKKYLAISVLRI